MRGAPIEVRLRFDRTAAPWVRDRFWHPSQKIESARGGGIVMNAPRGGHLGACRLALEFCR
jgi:hypothetical protein